MFKLNPLQHWVGVGHASFSRLKKGGMPEKQGMGSVNEELFPAVSGAAASCSIKAGGSFCSLLVSGCGKRIFLGIERKTGS